MSQVTFIWALIIGACVTMALPHLLIGLKNGAWANLFFVLATLSIACIAVAELEMMYSRTTEQIGRALQWTHVPIFLLVLAIAGFVGTYFGTGRLWLGVAACAARFACLVINFAFPPNLNFREITSLRHFDFLGETVAMPAGVVSPWTRLAELSSLLLLAFVIDASFTLWRRGGAAARRRALVVGGSMTLFIVLAAGVSAMIHARGISLPYLNGLPFLGVIVAMGFELSYDIVRAAQTARQLCISESALRDSREQLRELAARLESLREEERMRISREIHDDLGQKLTGLKMDLQCAERMLEKLENSPTVNALLDTLVGATELADGITASVQEIAAALRPGVLDKLGLGAALQYEGRRLQERTGIRCNVRLPEMEPTFSTELSTALFRIFQECLTNVVRHAHANQVEAELKLERGSVVLSVRDNGRGITPTEMMRSESLGLLGMKERAAQLGGEVLFEHGPKGGTLVTVRIAQTTVTAQSYQLV